MNDAKVTNESTIRSLLIAYLDEPDGLTLEAIQHPGAVYWKVKPSPTDAPKLVGRSYAHLDALTVIVKAIGKAAGELYALKFVEPDPAGRIEPRRADRAKEYDPAKVVSLLETLFASLGVGEFKIEAARVGSAIDPSAYLSFGVVVFVRERSDLDDLTRRSDDMSLIGAIGTLLRAIGYKDGVKLGVEVRLA